MKKKKETKRQRIIIYYALAIVLPCLILGILAFRGIKNDQALVEREQRSNLQEAGQQIIRETDAFLSLIENGFTETAESSAVPRNRIFYDSLLKQFSAHNQAVAGIFFISGTGDASLMNNGMLYVPDELLTDSDVTGSQIAQHILEKGWQNEFREKEYRKVLEYYQHSLLNISGVQAEGEILNAVARVQKKLKLYDEAIKTYDLIWNDYSEVYIQNNIPLGAVALLEKSLLHLSEKDTINALQTVHLLLGQMQKCVWELGYSNYANFMSIIDEIISTCIVSPGEETGTWLQKIDTVKDSLSLSEKRTQYLLAFMGSRESNISNMESGWGNNKHRIKTLINGKPYLFSLVSPNNQGQWGLILDTDYILNSIVRPLIFDNAGKLNSYWEVTDVNGELLLKSDYIPEDTQPVNIMFPSDLPSWSLTLYPEYSGLFTSLFRPGAGIFLYIFIAIMIILAFGLFFTLQAVNNEIHLSKMKSYFMSTVSHEFKSPLTSIRQMAEMLVDGRVPSTERQRKYHTSILQQSERLSHLIDNILDFSKMEEGQKIFRFEKADITMVVRDTVESFQYHTAGLGFDISLSIPGPVPDIVFDRDAMEQVMHNLLDNACKYSGDSRKIEVHLLSKVNEIIISVRDYGIGIRKEDHDKIFSRFYRAGEELTQTVKGSGIGLTIVKQIVEAHNGHITVESSPGKGSTFSVRLPVS
jgi:signal transduction histidine kinase/tetratricopeptide (TPR) repeat protein